jgi:hypothetical protein
MMNYRDNTHVMGLREAEVWTGFVSDSRVNDFTNDRDSGFGTIVQEPHERSVAGLLRVLGQINATEVGIIRPSTEFDDEGV